MPRITSILMLLAAPLLAGEIEIPSIAVPAVRVDDGSMKALIRTWDRRWERANAAAGDALRLMPHRWSPLGMVKATLDAAIAEKGWTAAVEREWLSYLAALKSAQARATRATHKPPRTTP